MASESSKVKQFGLSGLAGMGATCIVQPIDLIKTRMQLSGEGGAARVHKNFVHAVINIARTEGVVPMYRGLSAGLLRQATYTTARLGVYTILLEKFTRADGKAPPLHEKAAIGMVAGGVGAVVGTPAEVALIRMTSDGRLPLEQRRNYRNVFDALLRITREEGVLAMWRGCGPTVVRAMILNTCQLASYSQAKEMLIQSGHFKDNIVAHSAASLISGFLSTCVSMPVDMAKTRMQTMGKTVSGIPEYTGAMDVIRKTIAREGFPSLWKGFTPYFLRLGPHTIFTFIFLEKLRDVFGGGGKL